MVPGDFSKILKTHSLPEPWHNEGIRLTASFVELSECIVFRVSETVGTWFKFPRVQNGEL